jgi:hypothetical protein
MKSEYEDQDYENYHLLASSQFKLMIIIFIVTGSSFTLQTLGEEPPSNANQFDLL